MTLQCETRKCQVLDAAAASTVAHRMIGIAAAKREQTREEREKKWKHAAKPSWVTNTGVMRVECTVMFVMAADCSGLREVSVC